MLKHFLIKVRVKACKASVLPHPKMVVLLQVKHLYQGMLCHLNVLPGPFTAFLWPAKHHLGSPRGLYTGTTQRNKQQYQGWFPKQVCPFLSHNTDIADLIIERNPLWRESDTELSVSFQEATVMVAPSEELLFLSSVSCSKGQIFSVVKTGQGAPIPATQVSFLISSVIGKKDE